MLVDKVFEVSDPKTSSLDRETSDVSLSTFETADAKISDEPATFLLEIDTSLVSSTKLVAYESVTFISLAQATLTDNKTERIKSTVKHNCFFKIIYLHNNLFNYPWDYNPTSTILIKNILYKPFYFLNPI